LAKGLTPLRDLVLDGKRKQSHKNNATTKMREKPRAELEAQRKLHYDGINKRVQSTWHI